MPFRRRRDLDASPLARHSSPALPPEAQPPPDDGAHRSGSTPPEGRLDPVRWRRPGRSALLRWSAVAMLLCAAAAVAWVREPSTAPVAAVCSPSPPAPSTPVERSVPAGAVGIPVRLADPAALGLLRPGDRVDLMAAGAGRPRRVAADALVLGISSPDETAGLFLAVRPDEAAGTVDAPADTRFSVLVRPR